ncbi:MAG: 2-oxoacid:acceptor oxidoreductase family protein [bacterium]|nr:2-oxoacid:acceptor oxidoreductase family protein [bacterium]
MMRAEIRLGGNGGQGIILAAKVLAEAAGIYAGLNVVQSQIYGAAARGELSKADVIIDDGDIYTLEISSADLLLCLSQEAYDHFKNELKPEGKLVLDEFYVKDYDQLDKRFLAFPISQMSKDLAGSEMFSNMISVGILTVVGGYFSEEHALKAVEKNVPKNFLDMNLKAVQMGFEEAKKKLKKNC